MLRWKSYVPAHESHQGRRRRRQNTRGHQRNEQQQRDNDQMRDDRQRQREGSSASDAYRWLNDVVKHVCDLRDVRHHGVRVVIDAQL